MSDQTTLMANGTALGMEALMLINTVPSFTGDGTGSTIEDFLRILEQVGRLGGWCDTELIGIGRCKMAGAAFDFAWRDENVAAAVTYSEFKTLALKRFDTEPMSSKIGKFWNAKQNAAQGPVSDELEVSVMQWQVEMLANDEYGGESGDEVSLSCETPQMPTLREKGSERDEVGEKPREGMSESVAEIAPYEDEVALGSPEEAREERLAMVDEREFSACEVAAITPLVGKEANRDYIGKREVQGEKIRDWQL
ncbi:hypothetical protein HPB50_000382 [Hyalomma asiaticum]|uniref:Uncharacterized protein n=2 Tax=Hyalomma asiaticum TaxID=266040 RepID=A0ACB7SA90_HYAAI|nr:hypothetical protein HPB50_000381 [Hyalomma asiaticum]KAH6931784.1 hypothetical protein HPB50_000382 [Hyalomma asiaticum]